MKVNQARLSPMEKADSIASSHGLSKFAENRIINSYSHPVHRQVVAATMRGPDPLQTSRACLLQASMACPNAQGMHLLRLYGPREL